MRYIEKIKVVYIHQSLANISTNQKLISKLSYIQLFFSYYKITNILRVGFNQNLYHKVVK